MYAVLAAFVLFALVLVLQLLLLRMWKRTPPLDQAGVFARVVAPSRVVRVLGRLAAPTDPGAVAGIKRDLIQAGIRSPGAYALYLAIRTLLALALPTAGYFMVSSLKTPTAVGMLLGLAALGYFLPVWVVHSLANTRRSRIRAVFPNALDMLVNCMESGLGLDAAMRYVARELTTVAPELAQEFDILNAELQAGLPRGEALSHLRDRNGVDVVDGLVSVVTQAERYGVGIASLMRSHAKMSRRRRILDAEQRAAEATPKLTVAMVLFILPPLFIILIGPTAIRLTTDVIPTMQRR